MILGEIVVSEETISSVKIKILGNKILRIVEDGIINHNIPTLIIGWDFVKKLLPDVNKSILNKKINDNLFWTFSSEEDLQDFNEDIDEFIDKLYLDYVRDVNYVFIDPIFDEVKNSKELIKLIENRKFDTTYFIENFIYSYNKSSREILGFDLNYLKFLNINEIAVSDFIESISEETIIEDNSPEGFYQKYQNFFNRTIDKKYIPLFHSSFKTELLSI